MEVLLFLPFIMPVIILILASIANTPDDKDKATGDISTLSVTFDEVEHKESKPVDDGTLAEKFDTRFTNIIKNPWEDIL